MQEIPHLAIENLVAITAAALSPTCHCHSRADSPCHESLCRRWLINLVHCSCKG